MKLKMDIKYGYVVLVSIFIIIFIYFITRSYSNPIDKITQSDSYKAQCITIPYENLSADSEKYVNEKVTYTGKVIQVKGTGSNVVLGVDITKEADTYKDEVSVNYTYSFNEERVKIGDIVNIWGQVIVRRSSEFEFRHQLIYPVIEARFIEKVNK